MIILLLTVIISAFFAVFAIQNDFNVTLTIGYLRLPDVPFSLINLIFLITGFFLALVSSVYDYFISLFSLRRFDNEFNEFKKVTNSLTKRLQEMELELNKIKKNKNLKIPVDEDSL